MKRWLFPSAILALILAFSVGVKHAYGDATSATGPGSCADDSTVGTVSWTNPGNATAEDGTFATATTNGSETHYIKCTSFGFSIPTGATINGILAEVKRKSNGTFSPNDGHVNIRKSDGTYGSTNKAINSVWGTTLAYVSYGSSSDLWGETWVASDINSANFGLGFSSKSAAATLGDPDVDYMRITITYTPAAAAPVQQVKIISIY